MSNRFSLKTRVELAPGQYVHVPVQSWGESMDDRSEVGDDAATTAWLDKKIARLAAVVEGDDPETEQGSGEAAFADERELRYALSSGQVTYLLRVMQGGEAVPGTFREWDRGGKDAAPDAGSAG